MNDQSKKKSIYPIQNFKIEIDKYKIFYYVKILNPNLFLVSFFEIIKQHFHTIVLHGDL